MPSKLSTLIAALSAPDAAVRAQAAEQLAQLGPEARPAAVALVLASGDEEEEVREWAVGALEQMGPPEATDVGHLASLVEARSPDVGYWADRHLRDREHVQRGPAGHCLPGCCDDGPSPPAAFVDLRPQFPSDSPHGNPRSRRPSTK